MTDKQWKDLNDIVNGKILDPLPVGFIIDCPWLPNWAGMTILDYFTSDSLWFDANKKAIDTFPDVMYFPSFWSEFGMCSEPSAFGSRGTFPPNEFPHAHRTIFSVEDIASIQPPDPETDGLAPFMLNRLNLNQKKIEDIGFKIRFSISRGPLNIASYLMGTTEFLTAMMTNPDETHRLLTIITDYLDAWHDLQKKTFPSIDGILMLDDIIGFIGEDEFIHFGLPYLKRLYDKDVSIKFFHNDAGYTSSIKYLPEIGINIFNMEFESDLNELKELTDNKVTMLGNIPPRDVLAAGSPNDVKKATSDLINSMQDRSRVIYSCGGGMPPGVKTENIKAFIETVQKA
ncbi:Uroporphyrinogen decarboxylase [subsurface metagenome]